uniref:Uncharacterized protein n=1 Tax=Arundo donax TaxID=35708 RepID=A0A0A9D162_ARUDO
MPDFTIYLENTYSIINSFDFITLVM